MATTITAETAAKGRLRYLRVSPQKARLVVDQIRGKSAEQALYILKASPKRVAKDLHKLLWSAIASAREQKSLRDESALVVARAWVDPGPSHKRIRANSMGRAFRVLHRTSHITFVLSQQDRPARAARASTAPGAMRAGKGGAAATKAGKG